MSLLEKVKQWIFNANERGVPIFMARDPDKDGPSLTATLVWISATMVVLGLFNVGKIDTTQALIFFGTCFGFYKGSNTIVNLNNKTIETNKSKEDNEEK